MLLVVVEPEVLLHLLIRFLQHVSMLEQVVLQRLISHFRELSAEKLGLLVVFPNLLRVSPLQCLHGCIAALDRLIDFFTEELFSL